MKASEFGSQTMVGFFGDFPRKRGNCFSMQAEDGKYYRIVNFGIENLNELCRRNIIHLPINIQPINHYRNGEVLALVQDDRIPLDWYQSLCTTCYPESTRTQNPTASP